MYLYILYHNIRNYTRMDEKFMIKCSTQSKTVSFSEVMFYAFYVILTIVKGMGLYEGMKLYELGLAAAFLCLLLKLLSDRYSVKQLLLTVAALVLGIFTWQISGKMGALFNLLLLAGMQGIEIRKMLQVSAVLWSGLFSLQCFLTISGLRSTQIFRIHRKLGTYLVRWSMGFTHPNVLHITYFVLLTFLFYALRPNGRKLRIGTAFAMAGNLLIFLYSVSYTGVTLVTIYLFLNLVLQSRKELDETGSRIWNVIGALVVPLCVALSVLGPVLLKGYAFELLNKLLSTRLELSRQYLLGQGVHLLGSTNMETLDATITVDCSYVYMLVHYGLIYFVLFVILMEMAVLYYQKKQDHAAVAILLACAVSGVTEQYMANTSFKNVAMLLMAGMVYEELSRRRENVFLSMPLAGKKLLIPGMQTGRETMTAIWLRFRNRAKKIVAASLLLFIVGIAGYLLTVPRPSAVYASPWDCDRKEGAAGEAYVYVQDLLEQPDFDGWILSNNDAMGKLYDFDGITVDFEYARRAAGHGLALVIILFWAECGIALVRTKKDHEDTGTQT